MKPNAEGFLFPDVNMDTCANCGRCEAVCPVLKPPVLPETRYGCFAAYNTNESEREIASSGGMFLLIARWILRRGGVVFGAAFNSDFSVSHTYAEKEEEVYAFCGSKYVQSRIGNSYGEVRRFLEEGRNVLFTGTPCQIMGLHNYLGKKYHNLFTADIICHGVPSPAVWNKYVEERSAKDNAGFSPMSIHFRDKATGWSKYSVCFRYDKSSYRNSHSEDPYMRGFLKNLYLRPSCHNCIAKGIHRMSDFTLADFWGIQRILPDMYDNRGVSLVLLHSSKAFVIWEELQGSIKSVPVDSTAAINANSAAIRSVECHPQREEFFSRYEKGTLEELIYELIPKEPPQKITLWQRIRGKLGRIYRKLKAITGISNE